MMTVSEMFLCYRCMWMVSIDLQKPLVSHLEMHIDVLGRSHCCCSLYSVTQLCDTTDDDRDRSVIMCPNLVVRREMMINMDEN